MTGEPQPPERPRLGPAFFRGHGLGNDYLVFAEGDGWTAAAAAVATVCHRRRGVGADGVVCRLRGRGPHRLRMFNPDGTEFERSGNGLRVFAASLAAAGEVAPGRPFEVEVGGDVVVMEVIGSGGGGEHDVRVEMGRAEVGAAAVGAAPGSLEARALEHPERGPLDVTAVSVGNPHCVHLPDAAPGPGAGAADGGAEPGREARSPWNDLLDDLLEDVGPFLSAHPAFPAGANVQVVRVAGPGRLRVGVWERGAGRTPASGTSACAAAVAAVHRGRVEPGAVSVEMEGGTLAVEVTPELEVRLRGPVREVCSGRLTPGFLEALARS